MSEPLTREERDALNVRPSTTRLVLRYEATVLAVEAERDALFKSNATLGSLVESLSGQRDRYLEALELIARGDFIRGDAATAEIAQVALESPVEEYVRETEVQIAEWDEEAR